MPSQPTVLLHVWGVAPHRIPGAIARMAAHRTRLRGSNGLRFAKLLGTGAGRTFTPSDADPLHWALLTVWERDHAAEQFVQTGAVPRSWGRIAAETLVVRMYPVASRGLWSGKRPFGDPRPRPATGAVASLTRARIVTRKIRRFWRAVPQVSADLHRTSGLRLALGIGELPVGLQGTFSIWDSDQALGEFAHRRQPHATAIGQTAAEHWYAEELFARFAVAAVEGTYRGRRP